jgi:hypothetical protein
MQFRIKGKKDPMVYFIRSSYNKVAKRTFGKTIATQESYLTVVHPMIKDLLTEDEVLEFEAWVKDRKTKQDYERNERYLALLPRDLRDASEALEAGHLFPDEHLDLVFKGLDRLKKAMRKAGYKRAKKPAVKPAVKPDSDDQPTFFDEKQEAE